MITTGFWPASIDQFLRVLALMALIDFTCFSYLGFEGKDS
jgi:hypothetical protein